MSDRKPLISIAIPVLNEEQNIKPLYERLTKTAEVMNDRCDIEFIFSDNCSDDNTWALLQELAEEDPRVKALRFSRNFGFQRSILANYMHAKGDAVMQIDADLQDPPEMLEQFFDEWQKGTQVVYGVREERQEGLMMNSFRHAGYWLIDALSDHPIPKNAGDFRLIDRKVIDVILKYKSSKPYLRGLIASVGFSQKGIAYKRNARTLGKSKFGLLRLVQLGGTAIFNHSTIPLRAVSILGVLILGLSFLGAGYYFIYRLVNPDLPQGLASIHILVLFGIGLNAFLLGIIGEYLLRIYLAVSREPVAIVANSINFEKNDLNL
ncbi:glycosyltransferase family 2 protein [Terasakiella sp.]|uniref:glycosyltransferase family 2 protein n=1 Tax=Terasakiella sp. TaxID=2034861 RepID=UPI003AA8E02F